MPTPADGRHIEFAPADEIGAYDDTAREFMRDVLGLDYDQCFVSDLSDLSDFASCGLPDSVELADEGLDTLYTAWDTWVTAEVDRRYRVQLATTHIRLTELFARIEAARRARVH